MPQSRATTLFHFTKSADHLYGILRHCFYPRTCLEDLTWLGDDLSAKSFGFPMVSFCDIPLSRIDEHVSYYGGFGIGLTREWAIKSGLNPIFYISRSSPIGAAMLSTLRVITDTNVKEKKQAASDKKEHDSENFHRAIHLLAHMKPLSGSVVVSGTPTEKDFYLENEWRFVPRLKGHISALLEESFADEKQLKEFNELLKAEACLRFAPQDIRYIFVPTDADIPSVVSFMNDNLDHHSVAEMRILTTRITSLENMRKDV